ncbi:hypothetical protein SAMN05216327_11541 [Dyadobacter sp. SG02]|uniref:hypothetical protein n=1 Tax=Dyadobacter sp. SG02 TaxID=1855291 RepID=UPI0008BBBED3|nr:hypothetical protein [Dyadobacter sp. SG02]SEJ65122.1 hypothetical protein SAMN05216327_11541 [Dyadobacter sp. SG02]
MKSVVSLGLLVLLLSHTLGLSLAKLCLGNTLRHTSEAMQKSEMPRAGASAWHTFAELSERMLETDLAKTPPTPLGTVLKMMNDFAKCYLPVCRMTREWVKEDELLTTIACFAEAFYMPGKGILNRTTPPPEMIG